jgi:hypothetical protein
VVKRKRHQHNASIDGILAYSLKESGETLGILLFIRKIFSVKSRARFAGELFEFAYNELIESILQRIGLLCAY